MLESVKGGSPRLVILRGGEGLTRKFEKVDLLIDLLDVRTPVGSASSFFWGVLILELLPIRAVGQAGAHSA